MHGLIAHPGDGRVTHVLLPEGHLWGRTEVAIPVSTVAGVDAGVRLSITNAQARSTVLLHSSARTSEQAERSHTA